MRPSAAIVVLFVSGCSATVDVEPPKPRAAVAVGSPEAAARVASPRAAPAGRVLAAPASTTASTTTTPTAPPLPALGPAFSELPQAGHRVPPYFLKLFDEGRAFRYAATDDVDPHSPEGGRIVTRQELRCVVTEVVAYSGAAGSRLECSATRRLNDDTPELERELAFVSAPGGLWMTSMLPATQEDLATIIHEPPMIGDVPKPRSRSFDRRGQSPEDDSEPCTERIEVGATSACHEERCKPKNGYGETRARICFSRGRGLETLREENLAGPRVVNWKLVRIEEPPPPTSNDNE